MTIFTIFLLGSQKNDYELFCNTIKSKEQSDPVSTVSIPSPPPLASKLTKSTSIASTTTATTTTSITTNSNTTTNSTLSTSKSNNSQPIPPATQENQSIPNNNKQKISILPTATKLLKSTSKTVEEPKKIEPTNPLSIRVSRGSASNGHPLYEVVYTFLSFYFFFTFFAHSNPCIVINIINTIILLRL